MHQNKHIKSYQILVTLNMSKRLNFGKVNFDRKEQPEAYIERPVGSEFGRRCHHGYPCMYIWTGYAQ